MNRVHKKSKQKLWSYHFLLLCFISLTLTKCGPPKSIGSNSEKAENNYNTRRLLLRDEGKSQLSYIDIAHPEKNWYIPIPPGRDIQLVGRGRVLIGTGNGYEEREIATGNKLFELTSFTGTVAARKLRNGNTLLTGFNWQGKKGIVLVEVNSSGIIQRTINYIEFDYVRLVRETPAGNLLVTTNNTVFEGNDAGNIIWRAKVRSAVDAHAWQALRLANGQTLVSAGFAKNFQFFSADGKMVDSISGPAEVNPNFYAGFQILANGNYVVANWQGHGPNFGASGTQLLEYSSEGKLVWKWQQDSAKFSSIQAVIVLDGLDTDLLHIEDKNGKLAKVKIPKRKN